MANNETTSTKSIARLGLGRRILGEKVEKAVKTAKVEGKTIFGPRVLGKKEPPAATDENDNGHVSIAEIKKALASPDAPAGLLDALIDRELGQPADEQRKGAIKAFLEVEQSKGDDARAEVVERLTAALAALDEAK